jgi:hypothetical protein
MVARREETQMHFTKASSAFGGRPCRCDIRSSWACHFLAMLSQSSCGNHILPALLVMNPLVLSGVTVVST